ncbi:MAG: metallophosphoesterase [Rubellimicrobium sp.]|nr:metallophosphoesterase [Rubellimicrobium sp.]
MVFNRLSRVFRKAVPPVDFPPPLVAGVVAIVGDIHGRVDLLEKLLRRLEHAGRVVLVGDYIDRGEQSRDVLDLVMSTPQLSCIKGNHEAMCLAFLDDPERQGARWMRNGGLQTLASFGVPGSPDPAGFARMRDALALAMGDERIDWLRALPLSHRAGNLFITHAGADPARPVEDQDARTLLWGHRDFPEVGRRDGIWVAHGHVIVDAPIAQDGRVAVDTGAYATGRLTAAVIEGSDVSFVST